MTPDPIDHLFAWIRADPLVLRAMETAAQMIDRDFPPETVHELLRDAAAVLVDAHPELEVGPATVAAMLAVLVQEMRGVAVRVFAPGMN